ncbi:hypothetical protein CYMTET_3185 [Cymbomonas tetramitiformis]|uniref:Uncharacterized protein n=1 Tax=Cymbomonas tetramitiformis TaxID=36881 RepID=A0AAE0H5K5_9CHLO|nr:hypothetical protein CYMTET_3185 [Cymbomonas tetramitiformis]
MHNTHLELEAVFKKMQAFFSNLCGNEANKWADRLYHDTNIDDWKLNWRGFNWAQNPWGQRMVDRYASELSAQLPRYYAQRWDHGPRFPQMGNDIFQEAEDLVYYAPLLDEFIRADQPRAVGILTMQHHAMAMFTANGASRAVYVALVSTSDASAIEAQLDAMTDSMAELRREMMNMRSDRVFTSRGKKRNAGRAD